MMAFLDSRVVSDVILQCHYIKSMTNIVEWSMQAPSLSGHPEDHA